MGIIGYRTTEQKPEQPGNALTCQVHSRACVAVCSKAGCTKPILLCDQCLTAKDQSSHKCPTIPLEQLQNCAKHFQTIPPSISNLISSINSYYESLQSLYVTTIRTKKQLILDRLSQHLLGVKLTESQAKIYKALAHMDFKNLEVEHQDVNFVMELAKSERKELTDLESITLEIKENTEKMQGVLEGMRGLEVTDILERLLGVKEEPPKLEVICGVDELTSNVVTTKGEQEQFMKIFQEKLPLFSKLKLLFRASEYYYSAATFHQLTDTAKNTLVIARTKKGIVFGGYTPCSWRNTIQNSYQTDPKSQSFLFSLTKGKIYPLISGMADTAIQNCSDAGPIFGKGHDLILCNGCDHSTFSHANLGKSYSCEFEYCSESAARELAGEKHFLVQEYEVWQLM